MPPVPFYFLPPVHVSPMSRFSTQTAETSQPPPQRAVWLLGYHTSDNSASKSAFGAKEWAVLLTERTLEELKTVALHRNKYELEDVELGDHVTEGDDLLLGMIWDLVQVGYEYRLRRREEVKFSELQKQWGSFSGQTVGRTELSAEEIHIKGMHL